MSGPWEDYEEQDGPWNDYAKKKSPGEQILDLGSRLFANVGIGAMQAPGLPVEAGVALGNLANYVAGKPSRNVADDPALSQWGADAWRKFFEGHVGKANIPAPTGELEASVDKAGQFLGGGAVFGPAGLLPSATSYVGSEVGRKLDEAGVTGGYGETGGAIVGGFGPGVVRRPARPGVPTNEELRSTARRAYNKADQAGVVVQPTGMGKLNLEVQNAASDFAFDPALQPGIKVVLDRLDQATNQPITLKGIDTIRKVAGHAARDVQNASQRELAGRIIDKIDDFIDNLDPADVLSGDAKTGAASLKMARDYWKRLRKSEMIDEALYQAENQAPTSGTGGNVDNIMRQKVKAILNNPKKRVLFSKPEQHLMENVARGTMPQNVLRWVGRASPASGFLPGLYSAATAIGGTTGVASPLFAIPSVAGLIAKPIADAMTRGSINKLSEAVRAGSKAQNLTPIQQFNAMVLEMQRRARAGAGTATPALPGMLNQERPAY